MKYVNDPSARDSKTGFEMHPGASDTGPPACGDNVSGIRDDRQHLAWFSAVQITCRQMPKLVDTIAIVFGV